MSYYYVTPELCGIYWVCNWNDKSVARLDWFDKDTYKLQITDYVPDDELKDLFKAVKDWGDKNGHTIKYCSCSKWIEPEYEQKKVWVEPEYPGYEFGHYEKVAIKKSDGYWDNHYENL